MSGCAYLSGQDTMFADLRATGDTYLCTEEGRFANLHIVRYLHEVVYLCVFADDGTAHHGAVDSRVSAYLHVVLDNHIAYLRNFLVHALRVGFEAKTIRTDHHPGVQHAVGADDATRIYLHARVENGMVPDAHVIADIHVRVNLHTLAQLYILADVGKGAYVSVFGNGHSFGNERGLLDALLGRVHRFADDLQQLSHRRSCVVHEYEGTAGFAFAIREVHLTLHQTAGDKHHSGLGRSQERQVFLFGDEGQMLRLRLFNRRYVAHQSTRIAVERSA